MEQALDVRPRTHRQQGWINAQDHREKEVGDLFGWWITMRIQGRILYSDDSLLGALRSFNALRVRPLPFSGDD